MTRKVRPSAIAASRSRVVHPNSQPLCGVMLPWMLVLERRLL